MPSGNPNAEKWWSKATPDEKTTYRGLIVIGMDLLDREALVLTRSGQGFLLAIITANPQSTAGKLVPMPDMSEDEWWARSSPRTRSSTRKLARLMGQLLTDPGKALKLIKTHEQLAIDLVPQPITSPGKPLTN